MSYTYDKVPEALRRIPQWVGWKAVWLPEKQKYSKIPLQLNGYGASISNPAHFSTYDQAAMAHMLGQIDGIGFCFTGNDGLIFLDLDGAIVDGQWKHEHLNIMQQFPTWGEVSQSGKGVHLIAFGTLDRTRVDNKQGIELYAGNRFCAMTGWQLQGWPDQVQLAQAGIDWLASEMDAAKGAVAGTLITVQDMPEPTELVPLMPLGLKQDNLDFLNTGDASKWDGDRSRAMLATAMALYNRGLSDAQVLGTMWHYCQHIARDHRPHGDAMAWLWKYSITPAQSAKAPTAAALFESVPTTDADALSALLTRVGTLHYGSITDTQTIATARQILADTLRLDAGSKIAVHDALRKAMTWTKSELVSVTKEIEREARRLRAEGSQGLVNVMDAYIYVAGIHAFLHKPSGELFRPEAFVALHTHMSAELRELVLSGEGVAKVSGIDFDPAQAEFFNRYGAVYYNSWKGLASYGVPGDFTPWWNHLCLLVPIEAERDHLLNWMAFTLQRPHEKINHCVVFGGNFGIGKDTLFWPMVQALGRHAKQQGANCLLSDFNDYLSEAKLVVIQEVDVGNRKEASIVHNSMKPMLASPPDALAINPKGLAGYYIRNVVHSVLFTNEEHPMLISNGDRRHFVLGSSLNVMDRETGNPRPEWVSYFDQLWAWMKTSGGWEQVVYYLITRDINKFNPKAAPPMTESKAIIIEHGHSHVDTLIASLIAERVGVFRRDIVSPEDVLAWLCTEGSHHLISSGINRTPSVVQIGKALKLAGGMNQRIRVKPGGMQIRVWVIRNEAHWLSATNADFVAEALRQLEKST
jgi:hypothetical protein